MNSHLQDRGSQVPKPGTWGTPLPFNKCRGLASEDGPITFEASANSFGQLRKIELWLDGVKIGEDHWTWGQSGYFDLTYTNPSAGAHNATIYAADIDNTLQRYDFTFTASP